MACAALLTPQDMLDYDGELGQSPIEEMHDFVIEHDPGVCQAVYEVESKDFQVNHERLGHKSIYAEYCREQPCSTEEILIR